MRVARVCDKGRVGASTLYVSSCKPKGRQVTQSKKQTRHTSHTSNKAVKTHMILPKEVFSMVGSHKADIKKKRGLVLSAVSSFVPGVVLDHHPRLPAGQEADCVGVYV